MNKALALLLCTGMGASAAAQSARPSEAKTAPPAAEQTAVAMARSESPWPEWAADPAASTTGETTAALPAGTELRMKLETAISTSRNVTGNRFSGRVTEAVTLNGRTIIPVGAALEGRIARADDRRRIRGTPTIDLRFETIIMPNGNRYPIHAVIVDTSARPEVDVSDEGMLKGRGHDGGDWKETGLAAGGGAIVGGMIAGAEGTLIGAGVGATASVVHWLVKRRSADLPAGTEIVMELSRPMSLGAGDAGQ